MYKIHSTESLQKPALMVEWEEIQWGRVKQGEKPDAQVGTEKGRHVSSVFGNAREES